MLITLCMCSLDFVLLYRDMEEVRGILKECGELMTQAADSVPDSLRIALSDGTEESRAKGEATETALGTSQVAVVGAERDETEAKV